MISQRIRFIKNKRKEKQVMGMLTVMTAVVGAVSMISTMKPL
jgi:hypothetical protein